MNPFDTKEGYQALVKIGKPDLAINLLDPGDESARAEAIVAMMDWLFAHHSLLTIENFPGGTYAIHILRPESPTYPMLVREFIGEGTTLDEALMAAVNATEEKK